MPIDILRLFNRAAPSTAQLQARMTSTYPSFTKTYHHDVYPTILPTQEHLSCKYVVVVVTGAGTGIGQAIAVAFAQAHAKGIALLGRTQKTLEETSALVREKSAGATQPLTIATDITKAESVQTAFKTINDTFGAANVLVNNAGAVLASGSVADIDLNGFWKTFELNVLGTMTVSQEFVKAAGTGPRTVINIPSAAAHIPYAPGSVAYASSKLACAKIAEYIHYECKDWRVFNLQPGVVATPMSRSSGRKAEDSAELIASLIVWLTKDPRAMEINGRFLWANWDVDDLLEMKDKIKDTDALMLGLKGWAEGYTAEDLMKRAASVHQNAGKNE